MPGYIPPNLRNKPNYTPKKLSLKPKPIDWTTLKNKEQLFEEYRLKNYGKADTAWDDNSYNDGTSSKSAWSFHNPKIYH